MIKKKISVLLGLAVTISFTACNLTKQEVNVSSVEIEPSVTIEDNQFDKEENEDIIVQTPETNDDAFVPEEIVSLEPEENDDVINSESDIYNLEGSGYEEIIEMSCEYDIDTILEILGKGYKPPFYCQLDHIDEAGNFVIHQYELVNNGDEAHTATVDWITVNPKTGECENYMGDRFNIEERK
ncbi:MAG: hypothetical protein MJ191_05965 [Clostridium sp.]|nr:hypothetical protein [Clostridium sp.]